MDQIKCECIKTRYASFLQHHDCAFFISDAELYLTHMHGITLYILHHVKQMFFQTKYLAMDAFYKNVFHFCKMFLHQSFH